MAERNYYVFCDAGCKFPGMTKEQILTAIQQAIETGEIKDVDTGFITTIKEQNKGAGLSFWVGTMAEYNAIETKAENCFYIVTDDSTTADIQAAIAELREAINDIDKTNPLFPEIVVTVRGGSVSCKDENGENVAGIQQGNVWRFTLHDYGVYSITGVYNGFTESKTVEVNAVKQYFESMEFYSDTFANNDWQTIIDVIQRGIVPSGWNVGDVKTLEVNGDYTPLDHVPIVIIGKNHNTYASGGKAPFTFKVSTFYSSDLQTNVTKQRINQNSASGNTWDNSDMRNTTIPNVFITSLPQNVKSALKSVLVKSYSKTSGGIVSLSEKAFLLSEVEMLGTAQQSHEGEGEQYEYYRSGNKDIPQSEGNWSRSIHKDAFELTVYTNSFLTMYDDSVYYDVDTTERKYYPAFCF